ncbi:MAG TPA: ferrochelatase [Acidimicrobiia bacterium]|nr:ferrochelatase [Acidimicrobiia bacterium]
MSILLVGFGGPETLDQVTAFVASVLGRIPPEHVTAGAMERYRAIGGGSPLPGTTRRQADLLTEELARRGLDAEVRVGMLHARPTIEEAMAEMASAGVAVLKVISLAPYRCEVSSDAYEAAVEESLNGSRPQLHFAPDWHARKSYVDALAEMLATTLAQAPHDTPVIFAAHSLPQRMIEQGDPYADQLKETATRVAGTLGLHRWYLAYQSVSAAAREPWLGPSVDEVMEQLAEEGAGSVVVDPIGFIADHVETLYDNDIEHKARAEALGLRFIRCRCLNLHPGLIGTLADLALADD